MKIKKSSRLEPRQLREIVVAHDKPALSWEKSRKLKTVGFIAGKNRKSSSPKIFSFVFPLIIWLQTSVCMQYVGLNWILDAIWPLKLFSKLYNQRILPFYVNCKIWQTQQSHFLEILLLFLLLFNKKISGCWIWQNRGAIATSDFKRVGSW